MSFKPYFVSQPLSRLCSLLVSQYVSIETFKMKLLLKVIFKGAICVKHLPVSLPMANPVTELVSGFR